MALPKGQVLATTRSGQGIDDRRYLFLGERLNSIPEFSRLPSAAGLYLPKAVYQPRQYTTWAADPAPAATPLPIKPSPKKSGKTAVNPDGNKPAKKIGKMR